RFEAVSGFFPNQISLPRADQSRLLSSIDRGNFSRSLSYLNTRDLFQDANHSGRWHRGSGMSSNGNGLGNGKNGKKRRRRIIWPPVPVLILGAGASGVKAAFSPNTPIDPSNLASVERADLPRV